MSWGGTDLLGVRLWTEPPAGHVDEGIRTPSLGSSPALRPCLAPAHLCSRTHPPLSFDDRARKARPQPIPFTCPRPPEVRTRGSLPGVPSPSLSSVHRKLPSLAEAQNPTRARVSPVSGAPALPVLGFAVGGRGHTPPWPCVLPFMGRPRLRPLLLPLSQNRNDTMVAGWSRG